ncbi:MAG: putative hydrolase of the HAD superfamily [Planctomycetota bacterium]|jgi:putative hydrolase of the HAD superfamily
MTDKLDAIFFDIDDTLFSTTRFAETARRASIRAMITLGLKIDPEEGYRELMEVIREFSSNYGGHYNKFLNRLPNEALVGTSGSLLVAAAVVAYHETKFRELSTYEDVLEAMKILSKTDLKLGIITSGLRIKQAEKIIRLQIWPYIDHGAVFITDEVGIGKPNPKLYRRACERTGIDPTRAMYVGDHPVNDIDPANEIGMISVWNHRSGRHLTTKGATKPDYTIYNFLDLLGLLQSDFGFEFDLEI